MTRLLLALTCAVALTVPAHAQMTQSRERDREERANDLIEKAQEAFNAGKMDEVIAATTEAIDRKLAKGEMLGQFHLIRGYALQRTQKCAEAMPEFDSAISLLEPMANAFAARALCADVLRTGDRGLADITKAIELAPEDVQYVSIRCVTNFNLKNYQAATADCDKAVAAEPGDTTAMLAGAASYEYLGNKPQALAMWRKLLAADPANQPAKDGVARLSAGQ